MRNFIIGALFLAGTALLVALIWHGLSGDAKDAAFIMEVATPDMSFGQFLLSPMDYVFGCYQRLITPSIVLALALLICASVCLGLSKFPPESARWKGGLLIGKALLSVIVLEALVLFVFHLTFVQQEFHILHGREYAGKVAFWWSLAFLVLIGLGIAALVKDLKIGAGVAISVTGIFWLFLYSWSNNQQGESECVNTRRAEIVVVERKRESSPDQRPVAEQLKVSKADVKRRADKCIEVYNHGAGDDNVGQGDAVAMAECMAQATGATPVSATRSVGDYTGGTPTGELTIGNWAQAKWAGAKRTWKVVNTDTVALPTETIAAYRASGGYSFGFQAASALDVNTQNVGLYACPATFTRAVNFCWDWQDKDGKTHTPTPDSLRCRSFGVGGPMKILNPKLADNSVPEGGAFIRVVLDEGAPDNVILVIGPDDEASLKQQCPKAEE